ncbi:tRNA (adenosine(37)-N6)-threonylcarbamoyltransferase complex dimerization subunit type 1 TsaB [Aestuariibius insulae]|uniref:tRNA (adenosine(37)-N6)-threonylcarbamoyltransferase complex dimerization subunit type 1 TsaB n=1 Tax=Aestuariibius insulae TaxID=2058287 RepID=UPI00398EEBE8
MTFPKCSRCALSRPDPTILAFDTSAAHCAAALLSGGRIVAERFEEMTRGQAERLMPLLEEVLVEAGCAWDELDAIGVGVGPGNFTGIRIAVSAARGLALGLGVPAVGVSGFELLGGGDPGRAVADAAGPVLICLPAPRDTAYVQLVSAEGVPGPYRVVDSKTERLRDDEQSAAAVGAAAALFEGRVRVERAQLDPRSVSVRIAEIAARKVATGEALPRPAPLYVRAADAAPPREAAPVILDG